MNFPTKVVNVEIPAVSLQVKAHFCFTIRQKRLLICARCPNNNKYAYAWKLKISLLLKIQFLVLLKFFPEFMIRKFSFQVTWTRVHELQRPSGIKMDLFWIAVTFWGIKGTKSLGDFERKFQPCQFFFYGFSDVWFEGEGMKSGFQIGNGRVVVVRFGSFKVQTSKEKDQCGWFWWSWSEAWSEDSLHGQIETTSRFFNWVHWTQRTTNIKPRQKRKILVV